MARASYGDFEAVRRALDGLATVLMVSGSESVARVEEHKTFVDAAAAAGVEHLVYISFYGAAPDATFTLARDHFATEEHITSSGMAWTLLRDNLYLDFFPLLAGADGVIRGPAGEGHVAAAAQDDIAPAAVAVLKDPASRGPDLQPDRSFGDHAQGGGGGDEPRGREADHLPRRDSRGGLRVAPPTPRPTGRSMPG